MHGSFEYCFNGRLARSGGVDDGRFGPMHCRRLRRLALTLGAKELIRRAWEVRFSTLTQAGKRRSSGLHGGGADRRDADLTSDVRV